MKRLKMSACATATAWVALAGTHKSLADDIYVPADHATIQSAVNAAVSGDTIHIAPGVYVEQVYIHNKNLTLIGQPGTILRAFPNMALGGGYNRWRPILYIDNHSSNSIVRGLTFEGDQLADQQNPGYGFSGVYFLDSGGTVEHCHFIGFRESVPGTNGAFAVRMWNDLPEAPLYRARVTDNVIEDSYIGISVIGDPTPKLSYNLVISNNTIRGVGPSSTGGTLGMRGIRIGSGVTGSVVDNIVSGFSYVEVPGIQSEYPFAWGIIAEKGDPGAFTPLEPVRFENNTLSNNNLHMILLQAHNHEVINNHFSGTGPTTRMAGVWFSGTNVVVEGNVFEDMETGIRVGGKDPDFDTALGIATNAVVSNNRFCNVTNTVEVQPMATATVTGTETCPFPAPVLNILSWPGIEAGFSVQSAPTPNGPWNTLDATPNLLDGQNRVVMPADSDQQFFRLTKP